MQVKIHQFSGLSTSEMYDVTQTDDLIGDGDVFVCNGGKTVGFLMQAWPVLIKGEPGSLDRATEEGMAKFREEYRETFQIADEIEVAQ